MPTLRLPTPEDVAELRRLRDKLDGARGTGVINSPSGIAIVPQGGKPPTPPPPPPPPANVWCLVVAYETTDSPYQWTYHLKQARKTSAGYGGWEVVDKGLDVDEAYNAMEDINGTVDTPGYPTTLGIGVTVPHLAGLTLQPIPINTPVLAYPVADGEGGTEWWFAAPNGLDGACS